MPNNHKKQVEYWLKTADSDFETAEGILKTGKNLHYCLFFCHLALEKNIKALIAKKIHQIPPRTHDLEFLISKIEIDLSDEDMDFLTEMNGFNLGPDIQTNNLKFIKGNTFINKKIFQ